MNRPAVWAIFFGQMVLLETYLANDAIQRRDLVEAAIYIAAGCVTLFVMVGQINQLPRR